MKKRRFGLTRKFLVETGVPIILLFIQVIIVVAIALSIELKPDINANLRLNATAVSDEVDAYLMQFANRAEDYAKDKYLQDFMYEAAATGTYYADMPNANYIFEHLGAVQEEFPGVINEYYASGLYINDLISGVGDTCHTDYPDQDMINSDWMNAVKAGNGKTVFTAPYYDGTTGLYTCTVGVPVYYNGMLEGMLGIDILLDHVTEIFENATIGETGYAIAIQPDNKVYYHPESSMSGLDVSQIGLSDEILNAYNNKDTESVFEFEYGGKKVIGNIQGIGETGWSMIMIQPTAEAYDPINRPINAVIALLIVVLALILLVLAYVTRKIVKPIRNLVKESELLQEGNLVDNNCPYIEKPTDEVDVLTNAFHSVIETSREQANLLTRISEGDTSTTVEAKSDKDLLGLAMEKILDTMNALGSEIGMMTQNAVVGNTSYRGDATKFKGGFATIIEGFNATIDAIMEAVNMLSSAMVDIGNGKMPNVDNVQAKGDYIKAVEAIKSTVAAVTALTDEAQSMAESVMTGNYSEPANEDHYMGEFKKVIHGINLTLNMVTEKAAWYEEILNSIPMPVQVLDNDQNWVLVNTAFASNFVEGVASLEELYGKQCQVAGADINGVDDLVDRHISEKYIKYGGKTFNRQTSEIINLKGKRSGFVSTIQDMTAVLHQAEYSTNEVNRVEKNLNNLANGIFEIEKSTQVPDETVQQLADQYERIDMCIDEVVEAVEALVTDTKEISAAAVAGNLERRIDAGKHKGEYGGLASGVNETIDAILAPIEETLEVLEEVAKGSLSHEVKGDYKGDHARMKNAANTTIRNLKEVIGDISMTLAYIGEGDLTPKDNGVEYTGDFVEIRDSVFLIREKLTDILVHLNESSNQVANGAKQLASGASALAQGSTKQSAAVQELSATMNQVAEQTTKNTEDARQASTVSNSVMKSAEQGNNQMKNMLASMDEINESSANISKIIKVIDDIAFQTNILALNAAVEAARAGVHGKGFAVVADEVRNLAAKSAEAASETTALIEGSIAKVAEGTKIARDTAESLEEIVKGITETANLCNTIANVSEEQHEGIQQVNIGINEISDVIRENSATAQEDAASSEELYGQTDTLKALVDTFKLDQKLVKKISASEGGTALPAGPQLLLN